MKDYNITKVIKKKAIVFLISDFIDENFSLPLRISGRKHDLIAINISDRREVAIPDKGIFRMRDNESGEEFMIDFSSDNTRKKFRTITERRKAALDERFKKYNVDSIEILGDEDYEKPLFNFFLKRRKKYSR